MYDCICCDLILLKHLEFLFKVVKSLIVKFERAIRRFLYRCQLYYVALYISRPKPRKYQSVLMESYCLSLLSMAEKR